MTLTMQQMLTLRQIELEAEQMNHEQLMAIYLKCSRELITQYSRFQSLLACQWGVATAPELSAVPDEKVEIELLRSHYNNAAMLLDSLADEGMVEKMAAAARAAFVADMCRNCPDVASEFSPYHELSESGKASLRVMVRAMAGVLMGDFPATNCRNIEGQLEGRK